MSSEVEKRKSKDHNRNKIENKKQYKRSRKLRAGFLNIFKTDKPLARTIKRKTEYSNKYN